MLQTRLYITRLFFVVTTTACFCIAPALRAPAAQTAVAKPTTSTTGTSSTNPAEKLNVAGVENAGQISDMLYRGAQPSANGLGALKKLGVTTIVNLREQGRETEWERNLATSLGLHYVNIPIQGWRPPSDAQVAEFLKLFRDVPGQRVFVHCHYGEDRTGVMVAAYRIAMQNWTADQALREMNSFGFHYNLYRTMKAYVRNFPTSFASDAVFSSVRAASTSTTQP